MSSIVIRTLSRSVTSGSSGKRYDPANSTWASLVKAARRSLNRVALQGYVVVVYFCWWSVESHNINHAHIFVNCCQNCSIRGFSSSRLTLEQRSSCLTGIPLPLIPILTCCITHTTGNASAVVLVPGLLGGGIEFLQDFLEHCLSSVRRESIM
jgi:hypothetical protein